MSRLNLRDATAAGLQINNKAKLGVNVETLTAQKALVVGDATLQVLDPNAASQDVLLPAEADSKGLMFIIVNAGAGVEDLAVKEDSDTTTIATVTFPEVGLFVCDGTTWYAILSKGAT